MFRCTDECSACLDACRAVGTLRCSPHGATAHVFKGSSPCECGPVQLRVSRTAGAGLSGNGWSAAVHAGARVCMHACMHADPPRLRRNCAAVPVSSASAVSRTSSRGVHASRAMRRLVSSTATCVSHCNTACRAVHVSSFVRESGFVHVKLWPYGVPALTPDASTGRLVTSLGGRSTSVDHLTGLLTYSTSIPRPRRWTYHNRIHATEAASRHRAVTFARLI